MQNKEYKNRLNKSSNPIMAYSVLLDINPPNDNIRKDK